MCYFTLICYFLALGPSFSSSSSSSVGTTMTTTTTPRTTPASNFSVLIEDTVADVLEEVGAPDCPDPGARPSTWQDTLFLLGVVGTPCLVVSLVVVLYCVVCKKVCR